MFLVLSIVISFTKWKIHPIYPTTYWCFINFPQIFIMQLKSQVTDNEYSGNPRGVTLAPARKNVEKFGFYEIAHEEFRPLLLVFCRVNFNRYLNLVGVLEVKYDALICGAVIALRQ